MNIAIQLVIISCLIAINAFFAAVEIALVSVNEFRIHTLATEGNRQAQKVQEITGDSTRFLATLQVGMTLASFFTSATAAAKLASPLEHVLWPVLGHWAHPISLGGLTTLFAMITLLLGELVPKRLALYHSEAIALSCVDFIYWLGRLTAPAVQVLSALTQFFVRLTGTPLDTEEEVDVEEIKAIIDSAHHQGIVSDQEQRMIHGAVDLHLMTARAIMVPRVEIQYLKITDSLAEAYEIMSQNAHSRLPVCDEGLDSIVGILYAKDLIRPLSELLNQPPTLRSLLRPVHYVSEGKLAIELLREMQKTRWHLVIVQDEFGGTSGLVTLEDILEEIVGEIRDEYDFDEEKAFQRLDHHSGIFKLRASIGTVNNELDLKLPRDEAATLTGLFLEELQQLPEPGDHLQIDDVLLVVLEDGEHVQVSLVEPVLSPLIEPTSSLESEIIYH